jgi:hypothetical protein
VAIRWRKSGELLCAAASDPLPDDTYIDDRLHYQLSVELEVLVPIVPLDYPKFDEQGRWRTEERWEWRDPLNAYLENLDKQFEKPDRSIKAPSFKIQKINRVKKDGS